MSAAPWAVSPNPSIERTFPKAAARPLARRSCRTLGPACERWFSISMERSSTTEPPSRRGCRRSFLAHRSHLVGMADSEYLAKWNEASGRHWRRFELGELSFSEQRRARVREFLGTQLSDSEANASFNHYGQAYEAAWALAPHCAEFLERTKGIPKVVVTNGDPQQQRRKLEVRGLKQHVLGTITPADCGFWKPHPGIFRAALTLLGIEPESCLMIGDDPVKDIEPARALGMETYLVQIGNPNRTLLHAIGET